LKKKTNFEKGIGLIQKPDIGGGARKIKRGENWEIRRYGKEKILGEGKQAA